MTEIVRQGKTWHLRNDRISYILAVMPEGSLAHVYFGRRVDRMDPDPVLICAGAAKSDAFSMQECGLDRLPQEYPVFGRGDQREGAFRAENVRGTADTDLRFVSAEVLEGKPALKGLPALSGGESKTLSVLLRDQVTGLEAVLLYTVFGDCDAVARSVRITNDSPDPIRLGCVMSLSLDLPRSSYDLITLNGSWARERSVYRRPLVPGYQGAATRCGASSLQQSPFMALADRNTDEHTGEALGAALIYSGNFRADAAVYQNGCARMMLGINDTDFSWDLGCGESFQSPEAVLVWSDRGLGGMSRSFHTLWENHLLPRRWVHAHRPVLLNSWEAAYFDFNEDKLVDIASCAAKAGVELFVMDDGWFGRRDDDTTSLGDWTADRNKLPGGLERLAGRIRETGMQFGLWMEPEMVSPDSDLYRAHPDWAIRVQGRTPITSRHQLILDLSRPEVQDYIVKAVADTLTAGGASYLKWDMNRNFSDIGSAALPAERQKELPHRYILGLYAVMDRLTRMFPDVLIEGCSSGGGRFDPGMLYYVPQFWCSDNTDALSRCRIQYGTSYFLPPSAMGSHVSAVPNHQTGRVTPMAARFAAAAGGCFGYELDPRSLSDAEREEMRGQVQFVRETEKLRQQGGFYRLLSPFEGHDTAWMFVSQDRKKALFTFIRDLAIPNVPPLLVPLKGLDPDIRYRILETGLVLGGDQLMYSGLPCSPGRGDAASLLYRLEAVE